jgi:hypothetical protein
MNYIKKLQTENETLRANLQELSQEITDLLTYYTGSKFHGILNDYAHASTDVVPRLYELRGKITATDLKPTP